MTDRRLQRSIPAAIVPLLLMISGCGSGVDPAIQTVRDRVLAATAPAGERPVSEIREDLKSGKLTADSKFVIRARINAGDATPFATETAEFMVTDATGHDGDESHNPHECPFCKRDINNVLAWVEVPGDNGKPVRLDARQLFDLKEFDLLVLEGTGRINDSDILVMSASRIFHKQ